jgi:hypothetical protein
MRCVVSVRVWLLTVAAAAALVGCSSDGGTSDSGGDLPADQATDFAFDGTADEGTGDIYVPDQAGDSEAGDLALDGEQDVLSDLGGDLTGDAVPDSQADVIPDAAFIHAVREHADRVVDSPYLADEPTQFRTIDVLPDLDVRVLLAVGAEVWAGTPSGLYRWTVAKDRFEKVTLPQDLIVGPMANPIQDLALSADETMVAVAFANGIQLVDVAGNPTVTLGAGLAAFTSVAFVPDGTLVAGTTDGVFWGSSGDFGPVDGTSGWDVLDVAVAGTKTLSLLADGSLRLGLDPLILDESLGAASALGGSRSSSGQAVRVACKGGLATVSASGDAGLTFVPMKGELPTSDLTAVDQAGDDVLIGHARGASAVKVVPGPGPLSFSHYVSKRWLPDDAVTAVAVADDGSYWIGTSAGATRVRFVERRIADKESELFDVWIQRFWRMDGFLMSDTWSDDPWNPTAWAQSDFDNDGLWTQMGVGALCMAYSVTQDEKYYLAARKAMDTMFLEIDVPAVAFEAAGLKRGFITRSLVREDETALFALKQNEPDRWHEVTYEGVRYMWKDDTSSDETTGHFFGFPLFYDLCAKNPDERAAVAEHAGALARYIVDGGYTLKDLDGIATSFGHWEPERVSITVDGLENCGIDYPLEACLEAEFGGGWLNGIEILGHLLSAWHMTGDPALYAAYDRLVTEYRYDEVARWSRKAITVSNPSSANHSDHELAMLAYATLLRYEPNPTRRAKYLDGLLGLYEYERPERQPLWAAIVALAVPGEAEVAKAVQTLREMPRDIRDWGVDNSHRKDCVRNVNDRFDDPQWDTVFPYDEIRTMWWNGNPYEMVGGSNGQGMVSPTAFQLAYWAQRYAGILVQP